MTQRNLPDHSWSWATDSIGACPLPGLSPAYGEGSNDQLSHHYELSKHLKESCRHFYNCANETLWRFAFIEQGPLTLPSLASAGVRYPHTVRISTTPALAILGFHALVVAPRHAISSRII